MHVLDPQDFSPRPNTLRLYKLDRFEGDREWRCDQNSKCQSSQTSWMGEMEMPKVDFNFEKEIFPPQEVRPPRNR
jgi:hypothetical protein